MNDRDYDNLRFLLMASDDQLEDWYAKMSQDDIEYAIVLLEAGRLELIDEAVNGLAELTEANLAINSIRNRK